MQRNNSEVLGSSSEDNVEEKPFLSRLEKIILQVTYSTLPSREGLCFCVWQEYCSELFFRNYQLKIDGFQVT